MISHKKFKIQNSKFNKMIRHYFLTTIRTLRQNPLYTALSVFGIALTFVFVCILLLIGQTGKGDYIPPGYAGRTWQVNRLVDEGTTRNRDVPIELYEACISKMKTPEIIVLSSSNAMMPIVLEDRVVNGMINCINENFFDVCRFKFLYGRPINKQEIADAVPVAVIDRYLADQYFGKNEDPTGKDIEVNGIKYRVTGVVDNGSLFTFIVGGLASGNIWTPYKAMSTIRYMRYYISFTAKDEASIADVQAEFALVLGEFNTAEDAQYSIPEGKKMSLSQQGGAFGFNGQNLFAILILMLIPALNILSLNSSKSHDRSEEIAVRKAFGAPKHTIFGQLFVENTLITLVGAALGMCITPFPLRAIDNMMLNFSVIPIGFSLQFNWATVFWIAGPCVLLFSFLSGSIPAWITSKREIVNVLKGEEYDTVTSNWTRRRKLAWVFIQQALVFAVMVFCFTVLAEKFVVHNAKGDMKIDNIYSVGYQKIDKSMDDDAEANDVMFHNMMERVKEWPSVELVSISRSALPNMGGTFRDSISFNNTRYRAAIRQCDENFYKMFSPVLSEGQWFRDADALLENPPALVTQRLLDDFGLTGSAIGQSVYFQGRTYRIIGVIEAFKDRTSSEQLSALFIPVVPLTHGNQYAVKYRQGMGGDFSKAYIAEFYRNFPRDRFNPGFMDLEDLSKQAGLIESSMQFYVFGIPLAFLLIFAFMGTFGVTWTQSKKRMCEFGLRIAFGCTPARLMRTIIFENLLLTTFAMLPSLIVVANLYAFSPEGWEWIAAVGAARVLMWLFSAFSAWYPARQAARVQPVEALRANQ
jgi:ABC-type antimicrobial peptide transport system permease subunit